MKPLAAIQEHERFESSIELSSLLYVNCTLPHGSSVEMIAEVTDVVSEVYNTTKSFPPVGSMLAVREAPQAYSVLGIGYVLFHGGKVMVTVGCEVL